MSKSTDLHAAIMNLPTDPEIENLSDYNRRLYKEGHKDARHAAAELASEHTAALIAENARLREALEWITRVNAMDYEYREKARAALAEHKEPQS